MKNIFSMIDSYDGMLIETGGNFGRGRLGGDIYIDKCCMAAKDNFNKEHKNCSRKRDDGVYRCFR